MPKHVTEDGEQTLTNKSLVANGVKSGTYLPLDTPPIDYAYSSITSSYTGAAGSTTYRYRFLAIEENGTFSNEGSLYRGVTNAAATLNASNYIDIGFTVTPTPASFRVYRQNATAGNYFLIAELPGTTTTFRDTTGTPDPSADTGLIDYELVSRRGAYGSLALRKAFLSEDVNGYVRLDDGTGVGRVTLFAGGIYIYGSELEFNNQTVATTTNIQTFSNKRIVPRPTNTAYGSNATITPDLDAQDMYMMSGQSTAFTVNAPIGSPNGGEKFLFRFKDDGTARAISWDAIYRAVGVTLPTTTVAGKIVYIGAVYNATDTKWDVIAISQES